MRRNVKTLIKLQFERDAGFLPKTDVKFPFSENCLV